MLRCYDSQAGRDVWAELALLTRPTQAIRLGRLNVWHERVRLYACGRRDGHTSSPLSPMVHADYHAACRKWRFVGLYSFTITSIASPSCMFTFETESLNACAVTQGRAVCEAWENAWLPIAVVRRELSLATESHLDTPLAERSAFVLWLSNVFRSEPARSLASRLFTLSGPKRERIHTRPLRYHEASSYS
ncbi:hypothetical protein CC86DRAFT_197168 [Ophiobolus disseminans]|uniref:Uncharacterized protein n=1 Tax=Ophiobolus disseminans TaxID=1469910 RepID=A0A6A7A5Z1_9PLEO|nr:hypothetical protein CC86DRAFT_197168 [Ophiobolus disseminans]